MFEIKSLVFLYIIHNAIKSSSFFFFWSKLNLRIKFKECSTKKNHEEQVELKVFISL